jgi:hypothetical protein
LARRLLWLVTLAVAAGGFVAVAALAVVAVAALAVVAAGGFVAMVVVVSAVVAPTASAHPESMPHLAQVVAVVAVVVDWQTAPWTRATGAAIRSTEAAAAPLGQDTTSQQISSGA